MILLINKHNLIFLQKAVMKKKFSSMKIIIMKYYVKAYFQQIIIIICFHKQINHIKKQIKINKLQIYSIKLYEIIIVIQK